MQLQPMSICFHYNITVEGKMTGFQNNHVWLEFWIPSMNLEKK